MKPRNHVALALAKSARPSGAHDKDYREDLEKEIERETEEEMADRLNFIDEYFI